MKDSHHRFDVQSVLASSGQLSEKQLKEFCNHAASCEDCHKRFDEMAVLSVSLWTAGVVRCCTSAAPKGMTERFVARAIREGVPLHPPNRTSSLHHRAFAAPAVLVLIVVAMLAWKQCQLPRAEYGLNTVPVRQADNKSATFPSSRDGQRAADRKIEPRERHNRNRQKRSDEASPNPSFMNPPRWARAGADISAMKPVEIDSAEIAPALSAWLTRMNPLAELNSFSSRNTCDGRAMQPDREHTGSQAPLVFCFDPQITLVADSNAPDSFRPYWRRAAGSERNPMFRFEDTSRQIMH